MRRLAIRYLTIAALLVSLSAADAAGKNAANRLAQLPKAVQDTIRAQLGQGKLGSITRTSEDGEIIYDVEMTREGKVRGFAVNAEGDLLAMEVFLSETPAAVQKVIQQQQGPGKLEGIDRTTDHGRIHYEASIVRDGKPRDFTVSHEGELIELQMYLEELPGPIRKAIEREAAGGKLGDIFRTTDDGETRYEFEVTRNNKTRGLTLDSSSKLVDSQVFLDELPPEVHKTIQSRVDGGKLGQIHKVIDETEITYQAELTIKRKSLTLTLDPKGIVVEEEEVVALSETPGAVQKAITAQVAAGRLVSIAKHSEQGAISYEIDLITAGKHKSVRMDSEGKLLEP
jgi:uncharacterized membrane protein YkoI